MAQNTSDWITKETLMNFISTIQERFFGEGLVEIEQMRDLQAGVHANFETGLWDDDLKERSRLYGSSLKPMQQVGICYQLFKATFYDFFNLALITLGLLSILVNTLTSSWDHKNIAWVDGFAIIIAVIIEGTLVSIIIFSQAGQGQQTNSTLKCLRNGELCDLDISQFLVGDMIIISSGDEVPVDGLIIQSKDLKVDESSITGNPQFIVKDVLKTCIELRRDLSKDDVLKRSDLPSPVVLAGTRVISGRAAMIILAVGDSCYIHRITPVIVQDNSQLTPIQQKLQIYSQQLKQFGKYSASIIVLVFLIRFAIQRIQQNSFIYDNIEDIINFFIIGFTVAIIVTPKGVLWTQILAMAYSTKSMLYDCLLVRKLQASEQLAGVDVIFTDIAGTLTKKNLRLHTIWNGEFKKIEDYGRLNIADYASQDMMEIFKQAIILTGIADRSRRYSDHPDIEVELLNFMEHCRIDPDDIREKYHDQTQKPFQLGRGISSAIVGDIMIMRGSAKIILNSCSHIQKYNQAREPISASLKLQIETILDDKRNSYLETIALAYKQILPETDIQIQDSNEVYEVEKSGFTFISLLFFGEAQFRQQVCYGLHLYRDAGIKLIIATGDNINNARLIGQKSGILLDEKSIVMEGQEFIQKIGGLVCSQCQVFQCKCQKRLQNKTDNIKNLQAFNEIQPNLDILANCSPEDRQALIAGLQQQGHTVAITGYGEQDLATFRQANVSIVNGMTCNDTERENSDIILLDDNISSIIKGVMWGRNINETVRKLLQFQLTVAIVVVFLTFIGAILIIQPIIQPIQLLWANIIADTFACFALATEQPNEGLIRCKPPSLYENIITPKILKHILGQSIYQLIILLIFVFAADRFIPEYGGDEGSSYYLNDIRYKYSDTINGNCSSANCMYIASGRYFYLNGDDDYINFYKKSYIPSRHFTLVFNLFILLQLFNLYNSTKIRDEVNIFYRICSNTTFSFIMITIFAIHVIIVTFGGVTFHCYPFYGLRIQQWLICVAFGFGSILWDLILKYLPDMNVAYLQNKTIPEHLNFRVRP